MPRAKPEPKVTSAQLDTVQKPLNIYVMSSRSKEAGGSHIILAAAKAVAQIRPAQIHEYYDIPKSIREKCEWKSFFKDKKRPKPDIIIYEGDFSPRGFDDVDCVILNRRYTPIERRGAAREHVSFYDGSFERDVFLDKHPDIKRPLIAVLVGNSNSDVIKSTLLSIAERYNNATIFATSSPRTNALKFGMGVTEAAWELHAQGKNGVKLLSYAYSENDAHNPYIGLISAADVIVVSSCSLSMVADAKATKATVYRYASNSVVHDKRYNYIEDVVGELPIKRHGHGVDSNKGLGEAILKQYDERILQQNQTAIKGK